MNLQRLGLIDGMVLLWAVWAMAATQSIHALPDPRSATFSQPVTTSGSLLNYLAHEDAQRSLRQLKDHVYSGGTAPTSVNLTHTVAAVTGFVSGYYVSQGNQAITYTATRRSFVFLDWFDTRTAQSPPVSEVTFSGGSGCTFSQRLTRLIVAECATGSTMPLPSVSLLPVLFADTSGTAITLVGPLAIMCSGEERFNIVCYGAIPNDGLDDLAAIERAADTSYYLATVASDLGAAQPGYVAAGGRVFVPIGVFHVSNNASFKSGVQLIGESKAASQLKALTPSFTDLEVVSFEGPTVNSNNQQSTVKTLYLDTSDLPGVAGIRCNPTGTGFATCTLGTIHNVIIEAREGIMCGPHADTGRYCQFFDIDNVLLLGTIETAVEIHGNMNHIGKIDKEGSSGSTAGHYVKLKDWATPGGSPSSGSTIGNYLEHILLEQTGHANKTGIVLEGLVKAEIKNVHIETTDLADIISILDSEAIYFSGQMRLPGASVGRIRVENSIGIVFNWFDADTGTADTLAEYFNFIDTHSNVVINHLYSRRCDDVYLKSLAPQMIVKQCYHRQLTASPVAGQTSVRTLHNSSVQNWAVNGSFERDDYGWSFTNPADDTAEYIATEIGKGKMAHYVWTVATDAVIFQSITIAAGQVGQPITSAFWANITDGTDPTTTFCVPYFNGAGVTNVTGNDRLYQDSGWGLLTRTVVPQSAGTLAVGVWCNDVIELYVDEYSIGPGIVQPWGDAKFGLVEIGTCKITAGTAAPTTGTCSVCDVHIHTDPGCGDPIEWLCTTAGSPGTWSPQGIVREADLRGTVTLDGATPTVVTFGNGCTLANSTHFDVVTCGANETSTWVTTPTTTGFSIATSGPHTAACAWFTKPNQ